MGIHYYWNYLLARDLVSYSDVKNRHQFPSLSFFRLGTGPVASSATHLLSHLFFLEVISGQSASIVAIRKRKNSLGLRQHTPIGGSVHLRGGNFMVFFDRWLHMILPMVESEQYPISLASLKRCHFTVSDIFLFSEAVGWYEDFSLIHRLECTLMMENIRTRADGVFYLRLLRVPVI